MSEYTFRLFPKAASNFAGEVDALYLSLVGMALVATAIICVLIIGFGIHYRRGSRANRGNPPTNKFLELIWASVPFVAAMISFSWGAVIFFDMRTPPEDTLDIEVVAKQWMWKLQHPGGRSEINSLHVPVGQPVRLRMISEDVIHSFFVPDFRVKQDVLPAYYSQLWFIPTKVGTYHLFCAEYCGTEHSQMRGTVTVLSPADYARWIAGETGDPPALVGERLFERYRCGTCHKSNGEGNGPSLVGIYGSRVPLNGGEMAVADEQYLRDAILSPNKQLVAGFKMMMPNFQGQLTESDAMALIAYLKTLKAPHPNQEQGKTPSAPGSDDTNNSAPENN